MVCEAAVVALLLVLVLLYAATRRYTALTTTKLPAAQAQTSTPMEAVMKSVGMSTSRPMPIQKSAKRMAPPTAKATVERAKMVKRRRGRKLKMSWAERKDYNESCNS